MKKSIIAIFLFCFLFSSIRIFACEPILVKYLIKNNELLFCHGNNTKVVNGADIRSYKPIGGGEEGFSYGMTLYAQDKTSVYYSGNKIEGADPSSFTYLGGNYLFYTNGYFKDKNHIYYCGIKVTDADVATFEYLGEDMARDRKYVYDEGKKIETYDIASFVRIDDNYCKDKQGIYYKHQLLPNTSANDFQVKDIYLEVI